MNWTIRKQKTGFQVWHGQSQAGGWSNRGHFFVTGTYASARRHKGREVLERHGFTRVVHSNGYVWWKLPDCHIAELMDALDELRRLPLGEPL